MIEQAPAGWFPDPLGRHEHRYWDGAQWTDHVGSQGRQGIDPVGGSSAVTESTQVQQRSDAHIEPAAGASRVSVPDRASTKVQRQLRGVGVTDVAEGADEALFAEPVLVVNQKGKLFEVNAEYDVYDQRGRQIGAVREVGQSILKKAVAPSNRTRRLQVVDMNGRVLLALTQPTTFLASRMIVLGAQGIQVGQIVRTISLNHVRFRLESGGRSLGSINGENRHQSDFSIRDASGDEIGRITRTSAGLAKELFTKADNYVVEIHRPLDEPLRSLVIAASLAVDTALRQK